MGNSKILGTPGKVKVKPATALPWSQGFAGDCVNFQDADYIVHAANMYGPLVEALRTLDPNHPVLKQAGEA